MNRWIVWLTQIPCIVERYTHTLLASASAQRVGNFPVGSLLSFVSNAINAWFNVFNLLWLLNVIVLMAWSFFMKNIAIHLKVLYWRFCINSERWFYFYRTPQLFRYIGWRTFAVSWDRENSYVCVSAANRVDTTVIGSISVTRLTNNNWIGMWKDDVKLSSNRFHTFDSHTIRLWSLSVCCS